MSFTTHVREDIRQLIIQTNTEEGTVGPPGPQGIQGIQGVAGTAGADGAAGATGSTGPAGSPIPGEDADAELILIPGPQGALGTPGLQGIPGDDGLEGEPGQPGPPGPTGSTGSTGTSVTPEDLLALFNHLIPRLVFIEQALGIENQTDLPEQASLLQEDIWLPQ